MPQDDRKDFAPWKVEEVYKLQDGCCKKCGNPLASTGFQRHHKDGNHANNAVDNLELMCPRCHGSESYNTYLKQMGEQLVNTNKLIQKAEDGTIAGTIVDKTLDAIKLALSLNTQLYGYEVEKPPAAIQAQQYLESSRAMLVQHEESLKEGILKGLDMAKKIQEKS